MCHYDRLSFFLSLDLIKEYSVCYSLMVTYTVDLNVRATYGLLLLFDVGRYLWAMMFIMRGKRSP